MLGAVHALELVAGLNVLTAAVLTAGTTFTWRTVVPVGIAAATLAVTTIVPGAVRDPGVAGILAQGGSITDSREDRIASVQAGTLDGENRLWVAGTSMTTQTVDAKLMPLLPLMLRPGSDNVLTVAFGMGSAFRSSLIAGMQTTSAELVPSVPKMFGHFYDDAGSVIADPRGRIVVTDGRNFLELTRQRFDIIVTDPPPPITSAGASVISSLEYYEAGHRRLSPGGIMMQWLPFGSDLAETKAHLRTFRRVFPHMAVMFSTADYGLYLLGSDAPLILSSDGITAALSRPGVLEEINSAYDAHPTDLQGWARRIEHNAWISDAEVDAFTGSGPVITDDRPYAEYFWLRHAGASFYEVRSLDLRKLAP